MNKIIMIALLVLSGWVYAEPEVARHQFTSSVSEREPVDELTDVMNVSPLFYFTELMGFEGQTVTHRWLYGGEVMAEVRFDVKGARWRVFSSKQILPQWDGEWRVEVLDGDLNLVATDALMVHMD